MKLTSKLVFGVLFAAVFGSMTVAGEGMGQASLGQASGAPAPLKPAGGATTVTAAPGPMMCPISLRAQHLADGSMVQVRNSHPTGVGQWLHLTLVNPRSRQIVKATMTIHGLSNKARITQTAMGDTSDVVRTMTVPFAAASTGTVAGDVRVAGVTAVQRIDLDTVVYADGATESFAAQPACRVAPDPFMLVAGR